ncbi:MAG: hypothetical protein V3W34_12405 [Phycisphaerae bacterium]
MSIRRHAIGFFVRLIVYYTILAWPWPAFEAGYGRLFAGIADGLLAQDPRNPSRGLLGSDGLVRVYCEYDKDPERDIHIVAGNRANKKFTDRNRTSSRHLGYMPAAVLIALVLASPVRWRRRLWALLWGLVLVHAFVVVRFAFILLSIFHGDQPYALFRWDPPWDRVLEEAFIIIAEVPATIYVVPLLIWIAVTFRRKDWEAVAGRFA